MIALICGGRHYTGVKQIYTWMNAFHTLHKLQLVVTGGATGADTIAAEWALAHHVNLTTMNAKWDLQGVRAGYLRNEEMLRFVMKFADPVLIAFPGGVGTENMTDLATGTLEIFRPYA